MTAFVLLCFLGEQIETAPSRDFSKELQRTSVTATVQIRNSARGVTGSGTLISRSGAFIYILTAHHVVVKADGLEVRTFSAESYPEPESVYRSAQVIAQAPADDLALIRVATKDPIPAWLKICPLRLVPREPAFAALTVGCAAGEAPTCMLNQVNGKKLVRKAGEEGATYFWELDKELARGRSGGPLLERRGYLVGVASLANNGKGYCSPIEAIHRLLKQNGLGHLVEP